MNRLRPLAVLIDTLRVLVRRRRTLVHVTWVPFALMFAGGVLVGAIFGDSYWGYFITAGDTALWMAMTWGEASSGALGSAVIIVDDATFAAHATPGIKASWLAVLALQAPMAAVIAVAVHRFVLFGDERKGEMFPFAPGRTVGLYLVMGAVIGTVCFAIAAAVFAPAFAAVTGQLPTFAQIIAGFSAPIAGMPFAAREAAKAVSYAIIVLALVRLAVWPASLVARNDVTWRESLTLTRGVSWPLLVLFALGTVILLALELVWVVPYLLLTSTAAVAWFGVLQYLIALLASFAFWGATVFLAALVSVAYKALRGYRPDETLPG